MSQIYKDKRPLGRTKQHFLFLLCLLFFVAELRAGADNPAELSSGAAAYQMTVNGRVVNEKDEPIEGVTVTEKGRVNATTTDSRGQFSLQVQNQNAWLTVSNIGFVTQDVRSENAAKIVLIASDAALEEVVVVGFGTQKKSSLTTAISQIDKEVLQSRPSPSVVNMLQGASPGLVVTRNSGRPGAQGLGIQIRGATSATGNVDPLIVIDGVISSSATFATLNPNDIENISVLKDGGAAAIYGAQSAGGVLLVTTKRGAKGPARITLLSNAAWQRPGNIPERLSLIDEMNYVNLARANAGAAPEYTEEDLYYAVNGPTFVLGDNGLWRTYNQENILDQVVKDAYGLYNNNLQISGGSENISYLTSLGNMSQAGMFKVGDDSYSRWNARANISAQVNKYLKLDLASSYIHEATDNPQDGGWGLDGGGNSILRQFFSSRMRFPIFNEDGTYYRSGTSSAYGYALLEDGGFNRDRKSNYLNALTATFSNLVKGLEIRATYSREDITQENRNFRRTVTYYSGPEASSASQLNNPNRYAISKFDTRRENYQLIADYKVSFADKHNFAVMGGYQFFSYNYNTLTATTTNLYVNDNPSLNFTSDPVNRSNGQTVAMERMQSYLGRFNYNYDNRYLFEATVRSDESSRLSPQSRVNVFPSLSVGWNLANEPWFGSATSIFNELKPRFSWGKVGSQEGIGYYDYIAQLLTNTNVVLNDARQTYAYQNLIQATDLNWEIIETRNVGLDFSMLNGKLRGAFEYYNKYNNNMLVTISLPATVGINIPRSNEGRLKTWGWEAELAYSDKVGKDFSYRVAVNLADNQNRLVRFGGANDIVNAGVNSRVEGYALNSIWAYRTEGYFQTTADLENAPSYQRLLNVAGVPGLGDVRYVDINGDGEISPGSNRLGDTGDLVYLGDTNPRYQYGLNISLNYKGFDFNMFVQGIGKRNFKPSNELIQPQLFSYYLPMNFHMDYWTPENTDAAFPRPFLSGNHNFQSSDKWFLSGAYARLKNIQLGYTLRKERFARLPFTAIRLYASGEDLMTVSRLGVFKGVIDPEIKPEDGKVSPYPFATTISFGLNIDF
ncbi:TonB-dependent receptor [Sphingobacterium oryzagri]|uniref:TonB-dependent receptor n=1 Tax=Sphingobacterium oryzagri TaxID=3025669 RepID=A0ABY7WHH3_9SPHI|nr:TonB-dependent receptor [Sphingobacterium sp. KACC 22765]WDF68633.1 TonB-dependent receptor [Sphingobacterium sp. KACC 22765]